MTSTIKEKSTATERILLNPKYMWSRLENENVNFSLEKGMEICVALKVDIRTLLLPENRAKVEAILDQYEMNLESDLREEYIEMFIEDNGGTDAVLETYGPAELMKTPEDQRDDYVRKIVDDEIDTRWKEDSRLVDLLVVRSRLDSTDQKLEETFDEFFVQKKELEIFFSEVTDNYRKGFLELNSADGAEFEAKHTMLCRNLLPSWRELDAARRNGTLPIGISPRLIENPAKEQTEWIADRKVEEEMIAAAPSWDEMNPDHPRSSLYKGELVGSNPPPEIQAAIDQQQQEVQSAAPPPQPASQLPQLPIYGSARAGSDSINLDRGAAALSWTERPYFLAGIPAAYGCYVNSDSMYPVYSEGALLFVHPSKPVRKGDDCIVEIQKENEEPIGLVKRLLSKSSDKYVFEQFNPPARREFAASEIKTLHLVVGSLASGS